MEVHWLCPEEYEDLEVELWILLGICCCQHVLRHSVGQGWEEMVEAHSWFQET